jgi:thiamine pyrophosphokinase
VEEGFSLRAVIFANGSIDVRSLSRADIQPQDVIIAADGGAHHCLAAGLIPTYVVGDLDSLSQPNRDELESRGSRFILHPRSKDQTDLELAIRFARELGAQEISCLGMLGGRLDQTLANLLLLARPEWGAVRLEVIEAFETARLVRSGETEVFTGQVGDIFSLIPLAPVIHGVTTQGLLWPLETATLEFGTTLTISNEMADSTASVHLTSGLLIAVHRSNPSEIIS